MVLERCFQLRLFLPAPGPVCAAAAAANAVFVLSTEEEEEEEADLLPLLLSLRKEEKFLNSEGRVGRVPEEEESGPPTPLAPSSSAIGANSAEEEGERGELSCALGDPGGDVDADPLSCGFPPPLQVCWELVVCDGAPSESVDWFGGPPFGAAAAAPEGEIPAEEEEEEEEVEEHEEDGEEEEDVGEQDKGWGTAEEEEKEEEALDDAVPVAAEVGREENELAKEPELPADDDSSTDDIWALLRLVKEREAKKERKKETRHGACGIHVTTSTKA